MTIIARIPKNSREEIRLSLEEYKGHELLQIRVWYDAGDGEMRPGRQGLAIKTSLIPDLGRAFEAAEAAVSLENTSQESV